MIKVKSASFANLYVRGLDQTANIYYQSQLAADANGEVIIPGPPNPAPAAGWAWSVSSNAGGSWLALSAPVVTIEALTGAGINNAAGGGAIGAYLTGQTAAVASVCTVTSPNDGNKHKYRISGTVTITIHGTEAINLEVTYTDGSGTPRTCIIPLAAEAGALAAAANAADDWKGSVIITVNPNTAITVLTAGTFTGATYNVDGLIEPLT